MLREGDDPAVLAVREDEVLPVPEAGRRDDGLTEVGQPALEHRHALAEHVVVARPRRSRREPRARPRCSPVPRARPSPVSPAGEATGRAPRASESGLVVTSCRHDEWHACECVGAFRCFPEKVGFALGDRGPDGPEWWSPREQGRGPPCPVRRLAPGASSLPTLVGPRARHRPKGESVRRLRLAASELLGPSRRCRGVTGRISPSAVLTTGLCLASAAFVLWAVQVDRVAAGPAARRGAARCCRRRPSQQRDDGRASRRRSSPCPRRRRPRRAQRGSVDRGRCEQPEFVAAFADALDRIQAHVVDGTQGRSRSTRHCVTQAVQAAAAVTPARTPGSRPCHRSPADTGRRGPGPRAVGRPLDRSVLRGLAFFGTPAR